MCVNADLQHHNADLQHHNADLQRHNADLLDVKADLRCHDVDLQLEISNALHTVDGLLRRFADLHDAADNLQRRIVDRRRRDDDLLCALSQLVTFPLAVRRLPSLFLKYGADSVLHRHRSAVG